MQGGIIVAVHCLNRPRSTSFDRFREAQAALPPAGMEGMSPEMKQVQHCCGPSFWHASAHMRPL